LGAHRSTQESRRALEMEATRATATAFTTAEKLLLLRLLLQRSSLEMEATRATATAFTHLLLLLLLLLLAEKHAAAEER
jgi:hypothetical protein